MIIDLKHIIYTSLRVHFRRGTFFAYKQAISTIASVSADIRPENIICQTKFGEDVKLIDFGLARKLNDDNGHAKQAPLDITAFVAPEVTEAEQPVAFYTDMWSLGVVAYFLCDWKSR